MKEKQTGLSPEKAIEIAESIFAIEVKVPSTGEVMKKTMLLSEEQKKLAKIFGF